MAPQGLSRGPNLPYQDLAFLSPTQRPLCANFLHKQIFPHSAAPSVIPDLWASSGLNLLSFGEHFLPSSPSKTLTASHWL